MYISTLIKIDKISGLAMEVIKNGEIIHKNTFANWRA